MKTYIHLHTRAIFQKEGSKDESLYRGSQMDFYCESSCPVLPIKGGSVMLNYHPKKGDWSMTVYQDCGHYFDPETRTLIPIIHIENVDEELYLEDEDKWKDDLRKVIMPHLKKLGFIASESGDFDPKKLFKKK